MNDKEYVANIPNLSNEKLIDGLEWCGHDSYYNVMYYPIVKEIKKRLSKERKKGKWKNIALFTCECTECGAQFHELEYDNFCPSCGADMRGAK